MSSRRYWSLRLLACVIACAACQLRPLSAPAQRCVLAGGLADWGQATRHALRVLARRHRVLGEEITDLDRRLAPLVEQACPRLLRLHGVGYETAAQLLITVGDNPERVHSEAGFAALCGVAPVPASSGKTQRHRLCRGGDRQANRALYLIVCSRLATDQVTRAYRDRRIGNGLSTKGRYPVPQTLPRTRNLQNPDQHQQTTRGP